MDALILSFFLGGITGSIGGMLLMRKQMTGRFIGPVPKPDQVDSEHH
jgi:hypothetical protein